MSSTEPQDGSRIWHTAEAARIDVRGLEPPEPMVQILRLIDQGKVDDVLVAHLDREPVFLYPELDDRGWSHEIVGACSSAECVCLRMVRSPI
jgi:hypothetical protein